MTYLLLALFLFFASVMAHILYCRSTIKTVLHAKAFIIISFFCLFFYVLMVWTIQTPFKFTAAVIFVLMVPIYLCFYVLTQLTSPSKKILLSISLQGPLSYADIVRCVEEEDFINTRLKDLEISGCVEQVEGRYRLSISGLKIAGILDRMQRILGRATGG